MIDHMHTAPSDHLSPLESALRYASLGWSVIPLHTPSPDRCSCGDDRCRSSGKHPRIRWDEAMKRAARPDRIQAWWRRWPDANVGVVTGTVSGLAVVDIDPRNGGDGGRRVLEQGHGLFPLTAETRTGGGGTHLWFALDDAAPSGELAAGVELKAEGGMVVVPPSRHASGGTYRWRPGGDPSEMALARLPEWASDLARHATAGSRQRVEIRTRCEQQAFSDAWKRAGVDLVSGDRYYLCPFHDDHHPSLHIDAEGCRWYCFGCSRGGGIGALRQRLGDPPERKSLQRLEFTRDVGVPVTLPGRSEVEVVGESRHQEELLELTGGRRHYGGVAVETVAELVPEPDNTFDPDAMAVEIDERMVGYVTKEDGAWLRPLVDDSLDLHGIATCRATILGGWDRGHGDIGWFGVTLLLPGSDQ